MNTKRVLVMNAPSGVYCRDDRCQDRIDDFLEPVYRTPLEILYQAAILKKINIEFRVKDYSLEHKTWTHLKQDIEQFKPTHVIFNITTPSLKEDLITCDIAKSVNPNIITIARGLHFVVRNRNIFEAYPNLDIAIMGEFEKTFQDYFMDVSLEKLQGIVFRKNNEIIVIPPGPAIEDLDDIPFPLREMIDNRLFRRPDTGEMETTIRVSRGCPFPCTYCLAPLSAGKKIRPRSPQNIIAEIEECITKFGIRSFLFRSDLFTGNREWLYSLCDALIEKKLDIQWSCNTRADTIDLEKLKQMKKAGCWLVSMGVESGNQHILDKIKKKGKLEDVEKAVRLCKKVGVKVVTEFLIGLPWEGKKEIEETINFACKIDPDFAHFSPLYPYPGTEFYDVVKNEGLLKSDDELHPYALIRPVIGTHYLSKEEIEKYFLIAWKRFHLRPKYITRTFLRSSSPKVLYSYLRYGTKFMARVISRDRTNREALMNASNI